VRDPARINRILAKLGAYWKAYPDLRLGQIVVNLTPGRDETRTFNIEDTSLEVELDATLARLRLEGLL
jgi:hypothetical protein